MIRIIIAILLVLGFTTTKGQIEDKKVILVFNNGLGKVGIEFEYEIPIEDYVELPVLRAWTTSPYFANPGLRIMTKRGFTEFGFKNIIVSNGSFLSSTQINNSTLNESIQFFSSAFYFNKSYNLYRGKQSNIFIGIEPVFNYQSVSKSIDREFYLFGGRRFIGELNTMSRWEYPINESIFFSAIAGITWNIVEFKAVEQRLSNIDETTFTNETLISSGASPYIQLTFGLLI